MNLKYVRYKTYGNELAGIRLDFENGLQTPLFETDFERDNGQGGYRTLIVDTSRIIRRISMKIDGREKIRGLRLIDRYGEDIVDM